MVEKLLLREDRIEGVSGLSSALGNVQIMGASSQDPAVVRVKHAQVAVELSTPPEQFFNAFSRWAGYEYWASALQGSGHWPVPG